MSKEKSKNKTAEEVRAELKSGTSSSGNVKITLLRGGKKTGQIVTHNTGTIDMCEYITSALIGDYVIARRPGVIVPFTKVGETIRRIGNGSPYISSKLGATASYWETHLDPDGNDGGFCTADITFLIPSSIVSGSDINGFLLLSMDESQKLYARCDLPEPLAVTGDTNVKVEWTLYISYKWEIDRQLNN